MPRPPCSEFERLFAQLQIALHEQISNQHLELREVVSQHFAGLREELVEVAGNTRSATESIPNKCFEMKLQTMKVQSSNGQSPQGGMFEARSPREEKRMFQVKGQSHKIKMPQAPQAGSPPVEKKTEDVLISDESESETRDFALLRITQPKESAEKTRGEPAEKTIGEPARGNMLVKPDLSMQVQMRKRLRDYVHSTLFEASSGLAIVLNTIVMVIQLEQKGSESALAIGYSEREEPLEILDTKGLEHVFVWYFLLELLIRWFADGSAFWREFSNIADTVIVLVTTADAYLFQDVKFNMSIMRLVRLLRVVKIFRAFRAAAIFSELRVLVRTIICSLMSLLWSSVLLGLTIIGAGLFMGQLLSSYIDDDSIDMDTRRWAYRYYGGAFRPMWTMFEATLSGGWPQYARPIISSLSPWFAGFWAVYVLVVYFAVIRILSALFLGATLNVSKQDENMMVMAKTRELEKYTENLKHFFVQADTSKDGKLDKQEFDNIMNHDRMRNWLEALELEVHEVTALFNLISDVSGYVGIEEFVNGAKRMKGQAKATDSIILMHEQNNVKCRLMELNRGLALFWEEMAFDSSRNPFTHHAHHAGQRSNGTKISNVWYEAVHDDDDYDHGAEPSPRTRTTRK